MSSTEPPSRVNKGQELNSKAAQDALVSKGRVEKVREVDPDEQARQRKKFQMMMGDEDRLEGAPEGPGGAPSPFDLFSSEAASGGGGTSVPAIGDVTESPTPNDSYGDVQDAIVASPSYSPAPDLSTSEPEENDESTLGALPRSGDFWDDTDLPPDQPLKPQQYEETSDSASRNLGKGGKKGKAGLEGGLPGPVAGKKGKEPSPFGPPGKAMENPKKGHKGKGEVPPPGAKKELPSPFEVARPTTKEESRSTGRYFASEESSKKEKKTSPKEKVQEPNVVPFRLEERSGGGGQRGHEQKITEIEAPSLPLLPAPVQPMAFAATTAAVTYLSPETVSLYFQMVGQLYVMAGTSGISTTEIVLNNPAYANSRFFGARITVEKYATAPDSFNIRLTGSDAAVASFRENIPSLMTAFQNSNLPFRVQRIEAEYSIERPMFRRKERGESKGEAGGGDFGERRK
ncbi:MAG TPA: hypothetical protein VLF94_04560 [Chlamydiales bacterium]|nr:hypothetical protein [Chlamydiales bacterium]